MVARRQFAGAASEQRSFAGLAGLVGLACLAPACKPSLDETVSLVSEPILLAVRSDPAEAPPSASVKYTGLYVDRNGQQSRAGLEWAFCEAREPLAELGPVNTKCEQTSGPWFARIGVGTEVTGTLPDDVCKLFGPNVPPPVPGQPQGRPVDADTTGGFYDPVRILAPTGNIAIAETRLSCGAGVIPADIGVVYQHRYHPNINPAVSSLSVVDARGRAAPLVTSDRGSNPVQARSRVTLQVAWAACPRTDVCADGVCGPDETNMSCAADCTTPVGCSGAERFVLFDIASQSLVVQRESIAVAWYATAGSFDSDRTGRGAMDLATTSGNVWTAPATPGRMHLWVVLRDVRGGVGWAEYAIDVR